MPACIRCFDRSLKGCDSACTLCLTCTCMPEQDVMCGRFPNLMDCPLMDTLDASQSRSRTSVARRLGAGKWASQRSRRSRRSRGSYPDSDIWLKTSSGHQRGHLARLAACATVRQLPFSRQVLTTFPPEALGRCKSRCFDNGTLNADGERVFMCPAFHQQ
mmetsp:Transcript_26741/g.61226  ORF Transcript_26741/g.61226 Transcript_26741/m.61226 type:complete len:160 (-) Transcript_26741:221-700(-)